METPWDKAIRQAAQERFAPDQKADLLSRSFEKQNQFIAHKARRKALFCTRRGAKSYTCGLHICDVMEQYHEVNCLYLGLTKDSAMGIIWKDILQKIDRDHGLDMNFIESKRQMVSRTNSTLYISGADADSDEMQKLLGKKYKLIIIDEAQAYSIDLRTLIYGILGPTLVDQAGTLIVAGTAGNLTQGIFYDITNGLEPGWELFQWTALDNPYVAKQWQEELDDIANNRPEFMKTTLFKQWYLNQWVIDDDVKVYKYQAERNTSAQLPSHLSDWHYVLGLDLAHSPDSTAFVVDAYHEASPTLFTVFAHKAAKMDLTDVATFIRGLERDYSFEVKIVDGANKQAVAELNNRHHLGLIAADKREKSDFIKIMNDEYIQGKIQHLPKAKALGEEQSKLIWLTDSNSKVIEPRKEHPGIHNDLCDAALYAWRFCYQFLFKEPEKKPDPNTQEGRDAWEREHIQKLQEQVRKEKNPNELEVDWDDVFEDDSI